MNPRSRAAADPGRPGPRSEGPGFPPWPRSGFRFRGIAGWLILATTLAGGDPAPQLAPAGPHEPFLFAVLGDNRGDDSGEPSPVFFEILRAIQEARPAFVLNTGDMIYGRTDDPARARDQWRRYREAVSKLNVPVFHAPGNHDIWDEPSARRYQELWGPTFFSFDHGRARFIGLDTETDPARLGQEQFRWLERQLEHAGPRIVFVWLHRPLFPRDGAIGSSLDLHRPARDQLHRLFVKHRRAIKGVFLGHEHGYHFHERDGVPYYLTAGGGAELYMAPEVGGFHHFLLVRVDAEAVAVELKKVGAPPTRPQAPRRISRGELLESWEQGWFWFAWNHTVTTQITSHQASEGRHGLQLNFDLAQYPWPVLSLPLPARWDLRNVDAVAMDVYLPGELPGGFVLTPSAEAARKHEALPVPLRPGWNTVRTPVNGPWFPAADRSQVRAFGWSLASAGGSAVRGSVVFDNLRVERSDPGARPPRGLIESWERSLFWRVVDESVLAEVDAGLATDGTRSVKLHLDFARCQRPVLLARLDVPWDLTGVQSLGLDVYVPADLPGRLSIALGLRAQEAEFAARPVSLKRGWNEVKVALDGRWLPNRARVAAEQVEWTLEASGPGLRGWIACDHLRAE